MFANHSEFFFFFTKPTNFNPFLFLIYLISKNKQKLINVLLILLKKKDINFILLSNKSRNIYK